MNTRNNTKKKAALTVNCLVSLNGRGGEYVPAEELNDRELCKVKKIISQRISECLRIITAFTPTNMKSCFLKVKKNRHYLY